MPFTTELIVKELPKNNWELVQDLVYVGAKETFTVPAGFVTDFASVPRGLWNLIPKTGRHTKAAVLHDYFYATHEVSRRDADGMFRRVMKELGVGKLRRNAMWLGVRLFGWLPWKK